MCSDDDDNVMRNQRGCSGVCAVIARDWRMGSCDGEFRRRNGDLEE